MDFGEQGKFRLSHVQFDAKFMKGVTCSAIPSTTSCVKCLFSRREKELNRPCQCDTNLTTGTQAVSLLPPNATLSTAQNTCSYCTLRLTERLTGSLSNDDSDGNDNENGNRPIGGFMQSRETQIQGSKLRPIRSHLRLNFFICD